MRDGVFGQYITDIMDPIGTVGSPCLQRQGDYPGKLREEKSGLTGLANYKLVSWGNATALTQPGQMLKPFAGDTTGTVVDKCAAATDISCGIAPPVFTQGAGTVSSIKQGQFFWMQQGGVASVFTATGATAGSEMSSSAAGTAQNAPYAATTQQGVIGILLLANSSGSAALRPVQLQGLY